MSVNRVTATFSNHPNEQNNRHMNKECHNTTIVENKCHDLVTIRFTNRTLIYRKQKTLNLLQPVAYAALYELVGFSD